MLGALAAGGRAITLEHGISGMHREQVHSVATILGAWGEPQRRYHESAGPAGLTVVSLGWPRLANRRPASAQETQFDILFFGQPAVSLSAGAWPEDMVNAARIVGAYAGSHPHRRVAWKPHPASARYGGAADPGPSVTRVSGNRSISSLALGWSRPCRAPRLSRRWRSVDPSSNCRAAVRRVARTSCSRLGPLHR